MRRGARQPARFRRSTLEQARHLLHSFPPPPVTAFLFQIAATALPPTFTLLAVMLVGIVIVSLLLLRMRQSLLVAYFLCGMVIANSGVLDSLTAASEDSIAQMSEVGVMLLLFTLGMEFSLGELRYLRKQAFLGGGLQVGLTMLIAAGILAGFTSLSPLLITIASVAIALSSTAISVKVFQDLGLQANPGARLALAIAIFQDLFIIAFLVLLPVLFTASHAAGGGIAWQMALVAGKGVLFVAISWLLARHVIPPLLHAVADTRNRELFTLSVAGLCIGVALLAGLLELSLALGAFVAGLAVSESIYKHRILADVQPLRDIFLALFFVSVGLMIDVSIALANWLPILCITALLIVIKATLVILIGCKAIGLRGRPSALAALGLASGGEFSLILIQKTSASATWPDGLDQILVASLAISMGLVPVIMRLADPLGERVERHLGRRRAQSSDPLPPARRAKIMEDHAIVCGYGPVGQSLVEKLALAGIPSVVIELNAKTARELAKAGQPVLFADARHSETWHLAGVSRARLIAFTFPNAEATAEALPVIREIKPEITILARTKFSSEADKLRALGVNLVVLDEAESGRAVVKEALGVYDQASV
jgi:monovalent cation:H+ antiporter-2, CPA2 family